MRFAFEVNVLGPALGTSACVPGMRAAGGGAIVFVSSIASLSGGGGFAIRAGLWMAIALGTLGLLTRTERTWLIAMGRSLISRAGNRN
jgi:NAD(P)-dependent dehydrogenase (short-subunit alcohol dehydrogenase family)